MPHTKLHNALVMRYFGNKELDELYVSFFLKALAQSMILLFIPIYLYQLGYSIQEIAIYFIIFFTTLAVCYLPGYWTSSKLGLKKTMALGTFILIPFYYMLHELSNGGSYIPSALLFGISTGIYYSSFNIDFAKSAAKKFEGSDFSFLRAVAFAATIFGPLIGAFIIESYSFNILFLVVSIILGFSVLPLFITKDIKLTLGRFTPSKVLKADSPRRAIAHQTTGAIVALSFVFWGIFIYFYLGSILILGSIITVSNILMILILLYLGRQSDKNPRKTLRYGMYAHSSSWILRLIFLTPIGFFFTNLLSSISNSAIDLSFGKMIFAKAKRSKNMVHYFLFRELNLNLGRIAILLIVILVGNLFWMFVAASFLTFGYMAVLKE